MFATIVNLGQSALIDAFLKKEQTALGMQKKNAHTTLISAKKSEKKTTSTLTNVACIVADKDLEWMLNDSSKSENEF